MNSHFWFQVSEWSGSRITLPIFSTTWKEKAWREKSLFDSIIFKRKKKKNLNFYKLILFPFI